MKVYSKNEIKNQRTKLIKYIRINGYRLVFGIGSLLFLSALFFTWVGERYSVPMIVSAMIFIFIVLALATFFGIILVEIFVIKIKKYSDEQVNLTYEKLVNIELSKLNKKND